MCAATWGWNRNVRWRNRVCVHAAVTAAVASRRQQLRALTRPSLSAVRRCETLSTAAALLNAARWEQTNQVWPGRIATETEDAQDRRFAAAAFKGSGLSSRCYSPMTTAAALPPLLQLFYPVTAQSLLLCQPFLATTAGAGALKLQHHRQEILLISLLPLITATARATVAVTITAAVQLLPVAAA